MIADVPVADGLDSGELFNDLVKSVDVQVIGMRVRDQKVSDFVQLFPDRAERDSAVEHHVFDDDAVSLTATFDDFIFEFPRRH